MDAKNHDVRLYGPRAVGGYPFEFALEDIYKECANTALTSSDIFNSIYLSEMLTSIY